MQANRGLTVERMVKLGRISRSGFYRFNGDRPARRDGDMDLRDAIHRIALEWPSYGRPRITEELRRQGWRVNPKRVRRLLLEDNLLCIRKRKFVVTTDSNHGRKIYPNLAGQMKLTGLDQLWMADITYVRLADEFIFLAVILVTGPINLPRRQVYGVTFSSNSLAFVPYLSTDRRPVFALGVRISRTST